MNSVTLPLFRWSVWSLAVVTVLTARPKLDLERLTPVPETEPVPIVDFFRPAVLQRPQLNPSGTHMAAIVTVGEDRHELLVYELKTQEIERLGGLADMDIFDSTG